MTGKKATEKESQKNYNKYQNSLQQRKIKKIKHIAIYLTAVLGKTVSVLSKRKQYYLAKFY